MGVFIENEGRTFNEQQFIDYINTSNLYTTNYTGINALKNSDVFTGVNILAGDIAQSPFKAKKGYSVDDHILYRLNKMPKTNQSHYMMMYAVITNLILTGNAFVLLHKNPDGSLDHLEFVETGNVNVIQDMKTGEYKYDVTMTYGSIQYKCNADDILHFRLSTTDGWLGRSPLLALKEEVALQTNGLKVLNDFFARGVFAGGLLKLKQGAVDNNSKRQIKQDFEKANNGGGTIVLDETQEYTPNQINTEVLKLIQANKFSTQQIAKVLGIPVNRFGQELVNSSDAGQNDLYISSTIAMYEASICDELNMKLGTELELDLTKLMQDTREDRIRRIAEGRVKSDFANALTVNDAREYLGYDHIEGGEELLGKKEGNNNPNTKKEMDVDVNESEIGD
nr:MAG: portal protein [Bacteriophage sp.]